MKKYCPKCDTYKAQNKTSCNYCGADLKIENKKREAIKWIHYY